MSSIEGYPYPLFVYSSSAFLLLRGRCRDMNQERVRGQEEGKVSKMVA
jgi:hypothetical protein